MGSKRIAELLKRYIEDNIDGKLSAYLRNLPVPQDGEHGDDGKGIADIEQRQLDLVIIMTDGEEFVFNNFFHKTGGGGGVLTKKKKGPKGDKGKQGEKGDSLEFDWDGTSLGIRVEGEEEFEYVDLQGPEGPQGEQGEQGPEGPQGEQGEQGPQGEKGEDGTPANIKSFFSSIDLQADTPKQVVHNMNLIDKDAFTINTMQGGEQVNVGITSVDENTIELVSDIEANAVKVTLMGVVDE